MIYNNLLNKGKLKNNNKLLNLNNKTYLLLTHNN